jgi:predicted ATPase
VKLLVSGTFSSGKTTLVENLCTALTRRGLTCAKTVEAARTSPLPLNQEQGVSGSLWLFGECICNESLAATGSADVIICDGGPPDILAHTSDNQEASVLMAMSQCWQGTYNLVLWSRIDPRIPVARDEIRILDDSYRQLIDSRLAALWPRLGVQPIPLPHDPRQRVSGVLAMLD